MRHLLSLLRAVRAVPALLAALACALALGAAPSARAQGVEPTLLQLRRAEGALVLDFGARLTLSHALEDALQRGVPVYLVARATVYRSRWYWRDERVARVSRTWRLSYQPLTATWRVSLGGLAQNVPTLGDALNAAARFSGWSLAELGQIEPGERYYVEFEYGLDKSQLPQPMQIDLGQDWKLGLERTLRVEPGAP